MQCSGGEVVKALEDIEVGQAVQLSSTLPGVKVTYPTVPLPLRTKQTQTPWAPILCF